MVILINVNQQVYKRLEFHKAKCTFSHFSTFPLYFMSKKIKGQERWKKSFVPISNTKEPLFVQEKDGLFLPSFSLMVNFTKSLSLQPSVILKKAWLLRGSGLFNHAWRYFSGSLSIKNLRVALLRASLSATLEGEPQLSNSVKQGQDLSYDSIGISVITKNVTRVITLAVSNLFSAKETLASNSFLGMVKMQVTYAIYTVNIHTVGA